MSFKKIIILFFFSVNFISFSQIKLNIDDAYLILESQNLDLLQQKLNLEISKQDILNAKNNFLPTLDLGLSNQNYSGLTFDQISGQLITNNTWSNTINGNFALRGTIFQGFEKIYNLKSAKLAYSSKEIEYEIRKQSIKLEFLSYFFNSLVNKELYNIANTQLSLSKEQLKVVKTEVDLGIKTLIDFNYIESMVSSNELRVSTARTNFYNDLISLKNILDIPISDTLIIDSISFSSIKTIDTILSTISNNRNVELAKNRIKQNELFIEQIEKSYFPKINFSIGYGSNYSSERFIDNSSNIAIPFFTQIDQNKGTNIGISLNAPLFDAFQRKGRLKQSKIRLEVAQVQLEQVQKEELKIIKHAYNNYLTALEEYRTYNSQLINSKLSHNAATERYKIGMISPFEYTTSQGNLNIAELNFAKSKYAIMYRYEILKVLSTPF